jgi:hypothetical protein
MTLLDIIRKKIYTWKCKQIECKNPKKLILGREDYCQFKNEIGVWHCLCTPIPQRDGKKEEFWGMKITVSKRPYYVRVM